ncbi:transcriptional regulator, ArsR family [Halarchaeum acidiphilum MH1-52-1]|uniref:Transcriptional regulator, ArsR family n=1 Tax=Halarchaeum acidiphilum MH1-52-1 TaxID=1261545 RepID=U2YR97_9EURY|nr:winged helix-turn-helix domain-containing protein [Halarchaeum acidiphilum]GAD51505.1 transcriptional regulator, ArsR family [Halarchaeum acidiphilum MH1-52-1]
MSVRRDDASIDDRTRRLLDWIEGNENRSRVVRALAERPRNANQLATALDLHYRTITHHLRRLTSRGVVTSVGDGYGETYFVADRVAAHVETDATASGGAGEVGAETPANPDEASATDTDDDATDTGGERDV